MNKARTPALLEPVRSNDPGMELFQLWEPCQRSKGANNDKICPGVANAASAELSLSGVYLADQSQIQTQTRRNRAEDLLMICSRPRGGR